MAPPFGMYAKIDASLSGLLGPRGLAEAATASTLPELVALLRGRPAYADVIARLEIESASRPRASGNALNRTDLERALADRPVTALLGLLPYATAAHRDFVLALLRGFEVENIKRVLRRHRTTAERPAGTPHEDPELRDLGAAATVPVAKLRKAESIAEIIAAVNGTSFHRPLAYALSRATASGATFPLETALDDDHMAVRWRVAGRLPGNDRSAVRRRLGTEADVQSLCWIYRGRFLLGLRSDEVLPRLPAVGRSLSPAQQRALAATAEPREFAALVQKGPYARLLESDGSISAARLDLRAARILREEALAMRAGLRFHLGQVLCFVWLIESEVRDIAAIAECIHYGIERATIPQFMTGAAA